jgi:hypothetical protein
MHMRQKIYVYEIRSPTSVSYTTYAHLFYMQHMLTNELIYGTTLLQLHDAILSLTSSSDSTLQNDIVID